MILIGDCILVSAFNGLLSGAKTRWSLLMRGTTGRSQ